MKSGAQTTPSPSSPRWRALWRQFCQVPLYWRLKRHGVLVGSDKRGNRYYRLPGRHGLPERRMVLYPGIADPCLVQPMWHGWLHFQLSDPPPSQPHATYPWMKPRYPNLIGTESDYQPTGLRDNPDLCRIDEVDYEAWQPETTASKELI